MSRQKQLRINSLRARMAAVGADLLLRVGDHWEPNGSTELSLKCFPVVIGAGKRFFPDRVRLKLELLDEQRFRNGVVALRYSVHFRFAVHVARSQRQWLREAETAELPC
jgi:hypothetical protein